MLVFQRSIGTGISPRRVLSTPLHLAREATRPIRSTSRCRCSTKQLSRKRERLFSTEGRNPHAGFRPFLLSSPSCRPMGIQRSPCLAGSGRVGRFGELHEQEACVANLFPRRGGQEGVEHRFRARKPLTSFPHMRIGPARLLGGSLSNQLLQPLSLWF